MTDEYLTKKEFEKIKEQITNSFLLWLGLIFIVPVIYSIAANTKNYFGFYSMCAGGLIIIIWSFVKYFKWRKKYV